MPLDIYQQIQKYIEDKKHILVCFDANSKGDAIGSAVALGLFLAQKGKRYDIVSPGFSLAKQYGFLKQVKDIRPDTGHLQKCVLSVDVTDTGVQELSYDVKDGTLRIFITPKKGSITKDQIRAAQSDFKYDVIVALDTADLASLGTLYEQNTEFFNRTPIINIDHKQTNEHFGHINLIDITASSTAEILYTVFDKIGPELISDTIATALLTGMIAGTNSFKSEQVKPHSLSIAAKLVHLGADRTYIIKNLYQTKSIATFKLWGSVLSNLQYNKDIGLVWSTITRDDFVRSGAREEDLPSIINELILNAPEAKIIVLLHEHAQSPGKATIHGLLESAGRHDALALTKRYQPAGTPTHTSFTIQNDKGLKAAEDEVIAHISAMVKQSA